MSFFARTLHRLRRGEGGFSLLETVVALGILFISLLVLARTAAVGFSDIALSRQRTQANQIANKVLEQVRGLTYERVGKGLKGSDLAGDANIVSCPDGFNYYLVCPTSDPNAEKVVQSATPGDDVPLVPHVRTFGAPEYTTTYTASVYVTNASLVPVTGAFRVTALVSWNPVRTGVKNSVTTQSLLYTPEGTTDSTTGGGTSPFFYGTGSIGRAPVTLTPNAGVSGGTGVTGLPTWDSMTENLYGLEASVQQQTLARAESKVVLTGANKVLSGVETTAGGDTAEAIADNDPSTLPTTASAPGSLMQSAVSANVSGGGNSLDVVAASGNSAQCPPGQMTPYWMTGMEIGTATVQGAGQFYSGSGNVTASTSVVRNGAYSLRTAPAFAAAYVYQYVSFSRDLAYKFAIRLPSLPSSNVTELAAIYAQTSGIVLRFGYSATAQKFRISLNGGTPVLASNTVVAGQWYTIDIKYDTFTTTHTANWRIDGVDQPTVTATAAAADWMYAFTIGTVFSESYTAYYDDMITTQSGSDYPIGDGKILALKPSAMGTNSGATNFQDNDNTAVDATSWTRTDEVPWTSTADYVKQVTASSTSYVEVNFEDTTETCIRGVMAWMGWVSNGNSTNDGTTRIYDGSTARTVFSGQMSGNVTGVQVQAKVVTPAASPWTQAAVNGLKARIGYSTDVNPIPRWDTLLLEYYVPVVVPEGGAGTETGSTASTTAASAGTPCGNPTQVDGRACSYAREDYSTSGPPHLSAKVDLTGSGAGTAKIYKFTPSTAGGTSYVWGRRTAGTGGAGTVKETVTRYPGTHEFGALPAVVGGGPSGWVGYWVKFDAGTSAASVSAEAGIGSSAPSYTSAGTISYWNGTGYTSMAPPTAGGAIPATAVDYTAGGFRVQISGELASSPSFTSQVPTGASGTADRSEARATLGSPVSGTFTYKITNTGTSAVICDLTVSVDLGAITATARYAP